MAKWAAVTYFPDITGLDAERAHFTSEEFALSIPREQWEAMGRPGRVTFTPAPVIGNQLRDAAAQARTDAQHG